MISWGWIAILVFLTNHSHRFIKRAAVNDVTRAICNNTHELQPSVSFVNRYELQPERSLCKISLYKESAYWTLPNIASETVFAQVGIVSQNTL